MRLYREVTLPLYDYECDACGNRFELRQGFGSDRFTDCPVCSGKSRRKFHPVPIIYKGSGFYTTDYAHKDFSAVAKKEEQDSDPKKEPAKASKNGSDAGKSESKSEAKSESKSESTSESKSGSSTSKDKAGAGKEA